MIILKFAIITLWVSFLFLSIAWILFKKILPGYKVAISEVSFQELLTVLNASINTELDLWKNDVFEEKGIGTNSQYENYYIEITEKIISSLSPIYFSNMKKYITEEAIVTIIGRRVKIFLNEYVKEPIPDPTTKILFDE